jgi:hypothetical protein
MEGKQEEEKISRRRRRRRCVGKCVLLAWSRKAQHALVYYGLTWGFAKDASFTILMVGQIVPALGVEILPIVSIAGGSHIYRRFSAYFGQP